MMMKINKTFTPEVLDPCDLSIVLSNFTFYYGEVFNICQVDYLDEESCQIQMKVHYYNGTIEKEWYTCPLECIEIDEWDGIFNDT